MLILFFSVIYGVDPGYFFKKNVFLVIFSIYEVFLAWYHCAALCGTDYGNSSGSGSVILDDCNFHESVHLDNFDIDRTLALVSVTEIMMYLQRLIFVFVLRIMYYTIIKIGTTRWWISSHELPHDSGIQDSFSH